MFLNISIKDIIDIFLAAAMLYYFYRLMKESGSLNIFIGIVVFLFSWIIVSKILHMRLLGSIFDQLMSVGTIALVVIFREEGDAKLLQACRLEQECPCRIFVFLAW